MARVSAPLVLAGLFGAAVAVVAVIAAVKEPEPGTRAYFRKMSAASGYLPPHAVPVDERRRHADSCTGYNLELEEAAGIQRRIGHVGEAERLLSMRQNCAGIAAPYVRSAN